MARAEEHALLLRAMVAGKARWEPFKGTGNMGEVCVDGLRYGARLDQFGCPDVGGPVEVALRRVLAAADVLAAEME